MMSEKIRDILIDMLYDQHMDYIYICNKLGDIKYMIDLQEICDCWVDDTDDDAVVFDDKGKVVQRQTSIYLCAQAVSQNNKKSGRKNALLGLKLLDRNEEKVYNNYKEWATAHNYSTQYVQTQYYRDKSFFVKHNLEFLDEKNT